MTDRTTRLENNNLKKDNLELKNRNTQLRNEQTNFTTQRNEAKNEYNNLQGTITQLKTDETEAKKGIISVNTELNQLRKEKKKLVDEIEKEHVDLTQLRSQYKQDIEHTYNLDKLKLTYEREWRLNEDKLNKILAYIKEHEKKNNDLKSEITRLETDKTNLQNEVNTRGKQIANLKLVHQKEIDTHANKLKTDINNATTEFEAVQQKNATLKKNLKKQE